jgi:hypothetical protein
MAAEYVARRMEESGLFPAGEKDTYIQRFPCPRFHLAEVPRLEMLDGQGNVAEALVYRRDFVEYVHLVPTHGEGEGTVVGLALGPDPGTAGTDPYGLGNLDLGDNGVIVRETDMLRVNVTAMAGVLFIADDPLALQSKKYLFGGDDAATLDWYPSRFVPVMAITPQAAERLLATAGSSLAELDNMADGLRPGQVALTRPGAMVHSKIAGEMNEEPVDECINVIGFIPGTGATMGPGKGKGLDDMVIIVSAYYDGLGVGPSASSGQAPCGTLYPGANDNASGVAAMLEMARILKQSPSQPKKTIVFVAWSGGERGEGLSVTNVMNAKVGFNDLTVETVIELSGVGAGDGREIAVGQGSSFRLVQLFQEAAGRVGASITTRGRGPHFGMLTRPGFGGRAALSAYVSWNGADRTAHTPADTVETIDPERLEQVGQTTLLVVSVLGQAAPQEAAAGLLSPKGCDIEWRMENEGWRMENGEWRMENEGTIILCQQPDSLDALYELIERAYEQRAGGLLLLVHTRGGSEFRYGYVGIAPETIPGYAIGEAVAQDLLVGSGYTLDALVHRSTATPLSTTVTMRARMEEREVEARNVLGVLPGCDPKHEDEVIVVGAHYDAMGTDPDGAIYNGANDNASGAAACSRDNNTPFPRAFSLAWRKRSSITPARLKALVTIRPPKPSWAMLTVSPIACCISWARCATGWFNLAMIRNMTGISSVDTSARGQLMTNKATSAATASNDCDTASSMEDAASFFSLARSASTTASRSPVCCPSR